LRPEADLTSEHMPVDDTGPNFSDALKPQRQVLKADTSWRKWNEDASWCTTAWEPGAKSRGRHHRGPGSKSSSKSPTGQHNRSNRAKKPNTKRRQQWIAKTCESKKANEAPVTQILYSRAELAEKRKAKAAMWDFSVQKNAGGVSAEPQLFNLTAHDSDDDEADFFPGEARQLDDPSLLDQGGDDNNLLQASDELRIAVLDKDPLPQNVAPAVDVPLSADLKVSPEVPLSAGVN